MSDSTNDLKDLVRGLLSQANISAIPQSIEPIHRGGNNQIFRVVCKNDQFILKKYFRHAEDKRDRLNNEFNFLQAIHDRVPDQTPKALAKIDNSTAALYEYIEGETILNALKVTEPLITQAAQFIANLNKNSTPTLEKLLVNASEASFSISDHLKKIDFRIEELIQIKPHHQNDLEFNLILDQIIHYWAEVKFLVIQNCHKESIVLDQEIPLDERILSPSDFGFHNAIIRPSKIVAFIDFEYAGWDDPAKLVGDFFAQVAIKVDPRYLNSFLKIAFGDSKNYDGLQKRAFLLLNTYKIKWCCIVLNIFLSKHLARRKFSNSDLNIAELKKIQIFKARQLLKEISL